MPRTTYSDVQRESLGIAKTPGLSSAQRTTAMHEVQRGTDLPFALESTAPYASKTVAQQRAIAKRIASAKDAGLSGDELRAVFGGLLSGPARRKIFLAFGLAEGRIAPSYSAYRDGDARQGSRHAREHGAEAAARRAEQEKKEAAKLRRAARAAERKAEREQAAREQAASEQADAS